MIKEVDSIPSVLPSQETIRTRLGDLVSLLFPKNQEPRSISWTSSF